MRYVPHAVVVFAAIGAAWYAQRLWSAPAPGAGSGPEAGTVSGAGSGAVDPSADPRCDDGDPCTLDRWHRFRGGCIHVPDALCTGKACRLDVDCEYDSAECLDATCHEGECRYLRIAKDECVPCGSRADGAACQGTFCDPRECVRGYCRHAPRDCDDGDPGTADRCDAAAGRCVHERQRTDGRPFRCTKNADCIHKDGDRCFAGPCEQGFCTYREVPHSTCAPCTGDHDCQAIATFCKWPICTGTVCVVEEVPFCLDDNPHTVDECEEERKGCLHRYRKRPNVCATPPADDDDSSTVAVCHTETGETHQLPGADCTTSNRCWDIYEVEGVCVGTELHCYHDDACPARCDPTSGCVLDEDRDCHCKTHADCDLGNPCAKVFCLKEDGGACWGTFIDHCIPCTTDHDCRVDEWCVLGECAADGYCVYRDGKTCDDGDPDTYGFCHGQRDDPCTYEPIYDD